MDISFDNTTIVPTKDWNANDYIIKAYDKTDIILYSLTYILQRPVTNRILIR